MFIICFFPHWAPLLNVIADDSSIHCLPQPHLGGQQRWVTGPILPPSGRHLQKPPPLNWTDLVSQNSQTAHTLFSHIFWSPCSTDFDLCVILYIDWMCIWVFQPHCLWKSFVVSQSKKCSPLLPWAAYLYPPSTSYHRRRFLIERNRGPMRPNEWLWSEGENKIRTDCLRPPRHPSAQLDRKKPANSWKLDPVTYPSSEHSRVELHILPLCQLSQETQLRRWRDWLRDEWMQKGLLITPPSISGKFR